METNNSSYVPSRVKGIIVSCVLWSLMLTNDKFVYVQCSLLVLLLISIIALYWCIGKKGGVSEDGLPQSRQTIEYYLSSILVLVGAGVGVAIIDIKSDEFLWIGVNAIFMLLLGIVAVYVDMRSEE